MDIKEIKLKKEILKNDISDLLKKYTEETGVKITDLSCEAVDTIAGETQYYVVDFDIKL